MFEILKPFLTAEFIGKIARNGIQGAMGGLVANGMFTGDQVQQIAGVVGMIASAAWTAYAHKTATVAAPATPANDATGGLF